eukprot:CAMPEP_0172832152 /NCGR_PEP_ID=MMETSP1075-20121228/23452_1 /TAXON_ID=2916 /ORGANISM="Ceratium fusus, Strain PA161109" /LENGTH=68 /DNA_ID=CAMNT_0013674707 /DNA_START=1233 /DNA_END=1440 /DNA_ORIENTATION=+
MTSHSAPSAVDVMLLLLDVSTLQLRAARDKFAAGAFGQLPEPALDAGLPDGAERCHTKVTSGGHLAAD